MARPSGRTRTWNNTSEASATTSMTTGPNSFLWQNVCTTTQCMLRLGWDHSGPCTIGTPRCYWKHYKGHFWNRRSKRMLRSRDWQWLIGLSESTYWTPSSGRQSTPAENRLCSTLETKCGPRPDTSGNICHVRSLTLNERNCTLRVKLSIGMITN